MSAKMADRRRRRRVKSNEDSEEYSEESVDEQEVDKASEAESVDESKEPVVVDSEYESAEEEKTSEKKVQENQVDLKESSPIPEIEVVSDNGLEEEEEEECEEINAVGEEGGVEDTADETLIDGEVVEDEENDDDDEEDDEEFGEGEIVEEDGDEEGLNEEQQEWKEGERQQGDGQESQTLQMKEKVLDDDEDKRNPQYIPKKGGFYEHDDRLVDDEEEEKEEEKDKKGNKKKLWREDNTWQHDRFIEDEQKPKSKDELVNAYGYDIRNEDDAPRARRRRKFTGPTKYTRRWNDEEAYIKTSPKWKGSEIGRRGGRGMRGRGMIGPRRGWNRIAGNNGDRIDTKIQMGFQPRSFSNREMSERNDNTKNEVNNESNAAVRSSHSESELDEISETKLSLVSQENILNPQNFPPLTKEENRSNSPTIVNQSRSGGEIIGPEKPVRIEVRPRGGGRGGGLIRRGGGDRRPFSSTLRRDNRRYNNNDSGSGDNLTRSFEKLAIKDQVDKKRDFKRDLRSTNRHSSGVIEQRRQVTVPPRLQEAASTNRPPKRYSSQRQKNAGGYQRSPPPNTAPLPPRFCDHAVEYHSSVPESSYQQQMYTDSPPSNPPLQTNGPMIPPPPPQTFAGYNPQGYQEPYVGIRPMASPPRIYAPVTMPTGTIAAGQPVMPSPYMSPNNNLINYGPPANYPQYTFTPQPPPQYSTTVPTPQEFYRGGMAYYNTQSQQYPPPMNHMKRPKAAIPIVPPPDLKDNEVEDGDDKSIEIEGPIDDSIHSSEVAVEG